MEEPEEDVRVLICAPVDGEPPTVPGSCIILADCGHQVWVAPSGQIARSKHKMTVRCTPCCPEVWKDMGKVRFNKGSLEEFEQVLGSRQREAMERVFRAMGVTEDE